jgi:hypothetical protein
MASAAADRMAFYCALCGVGVCCAELSFTQHAMLSSCRTCCSR